jgi:transcriptional regulator with XRE-family HTH domain
MSCPIHGATVASMSTRGSYPNDWARLIAELTERDGWNQTKFAKAVGVGRNTPGRWIRGESANVTVETIRLIAEFAGIPESTAARAALGAQAQVQAEDDAMVRDIMHSDAPEHVKQQAIAQVRSVRAEQEESLRRQIDFLLRTHKPQPEG